MIPMRDGVRLHTQVFSPTQSTEKLPFVLNRTPYGIGQMDSARLNASLPELAAEGYIFVMQDIRGRFKSEGQFVMLRQPRDHNDKQAIDESTDTYDTIDWLLKNVPNNNGRVGMAGSQLWRLADRDGDAGSASRIKGRRPRRFAGRHVDRRRFPSQRRFSPELWLRIRVHDGIFKRDYRSLAGDRPF